MKVTSNALDITIEIEDHSQEVLDALANAMDRGLDAIGEAAVGHAKDIIIEEDRVDTGTMMNSIDFGKGDDFVAIGTNVEYAPYQELGTSRGIKPARFLTRAVQDFTDEYQNLMKDSLENA